MVVKKKQTGKPVFVSYSGPLSRSVAFAVRRLLESTLSIDVFVAEVSVDAGERWLTTIQQGLKDAQVAVLCMTRENVYRPWVYFEAGGAALIGAQVVPLLVGVDSSELPSPLSLYQTCAATRDGLWQVVEQIRTRVARSSPPVEPDRFDEAWAAFCESVPEEPVPYGRWDSVLRAEQLLDTGITHAWRQRKDATSMMLQDISEARQSVTMIARVYLSELVKDEAFAPTLTRWAAGKADGERLVTLIGSDPDDVALMNEQYAVENRLHFFDNLDHYLTHVKSKAKGTALVVEEAIALGLSLRTHRPATVRLTTSCVAGPLLPWCFLEIDRRVVYVSFYRRHGAATYGTNAATLRAERPEKGDARFFDQLVDEVAGLVKTATGVRSTLITGER